MIELVKEKKDCCGCFACYNVCPVCAITMVEDERGFKYPKIDENKCIQCNKCKNVCSILNKIDIEVEPKAYACINKNEDIRMKSSSGGVFTLLSEFVLEKNGVVFGVAWNEDFSEVNHIYVTNKEELRLMRGSKYLQSNINDTYKKAKEFLEEGKYVLFSGTPCQTTGLKKYLNKDYENLILQDIICHGVPSPFAWKKYIELYQDEINNVEFRNKDDDGWNDFHMKINFNNGKSHNVKFNKDIYMNAFLKNLILRESCTNCNFKTKNRVADITLADFWGINNVLPEMNDEKGTSLVIINSKKGQDIFDELSEKMKYKEVELLKAVKYNSNYDNISLKGKKSNEFFEDLMKEDFNKVAKRYIPKDSIFKKVKNKLKSIIKKILKKIIKNK